MAQSMETWLGNRRVAISSPARTTVCSVDWCLERCQFTSWHCCRVALEQATEPLTAPWRRYVAAYHI